MAANPDEARALLALYAVHYVNHNDLAAFNLTVDQLPDEYNMVYARSLTEGDVSPINIQEEFQTINQLILVGLHDDKIIGICFNVFVATCIVARYNPSHNQVDPVNQERFTVGGEGGHIREAHRQNQRLLADQDLESVGNSAMIQAIEAQSLVRLVWHGNINRNGPNNLIHSRRGYTYVGTYQVMNHFEEHTPEGFLVHVFDLRRVHVLPRDIRTFEVLLRTYEVREVKMELKCFK